MTRAIVLAAVLASACGGSVADETDAGSTVECVPYGAGMAPVACNPAHPWIWRAWDGGADATACTAAECPSGDPCAVGEVLGVCR